MEPLLASEEPCWPKIAIGCSTPSAKSCSVRASKPGSKPAATSCARVTTYQPSALTEIFAAGSESRYALETSALLGGALGGTGAPGRQGKASGSGDAAGRDFVSWFSSIAGEYDAASETVESGVTGPCVLRIPLRSTSSSVEDEPAAPCGSIHW